MGETRYVGKPATRVDALEKVLGTAKYVADYRLPGMLQARALARVFEPEAGGRPA